MIRRWARWLVRFAAVVAELYEHELRQARQRRYEREHPPYPAPRLLTATDSPEMDAVNEWLVRKHLHDALHRFSPSEQTPEA